MVAQLRYIIIDCREPGTLADSWAALLGWDIVYNEADGALLPDPSGSSPKLFFQRVPEPKSGKNRAHIDLETADFEGELNHLRHLGATVVRAQEPSDGRPSAVLADPQGNEFCLAGAVATG
jgi:hypothetical protein